MLSNKYYQPALLGWWQAAIKIFFFLGLGYTAQRLVAVNFQVDPMVWGCATFLSAAFWLLIIGYKGEVAQDVLKRPHTWVFGIFLLLIAIINTFLFQQITSTEVAFLHRVTMLVGLVIGMFFLGRKQGFDRLVSAILVAIGVSIILASVEPEKQVFVYTAIAMVAIMGAIRIFVAEFHPENNQYMTFRSRCCMAGIVTAVTSILLLFVSLFIAYIQSLSENPIAFLPEFKDFTEAGSVFGGMVLGTLFVTPIRYLEFSSIRLIKAENHFAMAALAPLAVLLWETIFAGLGLFEVRTLSKLDLMAGALITIGAVFTIYFRVKKDMGGSFDLMDYMSKVSKEAHKAERQAKQEESASRERLEDMFMEVQDAHDIVHDTMQRYKGNKAKVADMLDIPVEVVETVQTKPDILLKEHVLKKMERSYRNRVVVTDPLTDLSNAFHFNNRLKEAVLEHSLFSVIFIDLNKFKPINDTHGHDAGDRVLQTVGNRIDAYVSDDDISARLGGDEFAIILYDIDAATTKVVAGELKKLLAKPYTELADITPPIEIGASIGMATFPQDGDSAESILKKADERMYKDKKGKGR